MKNDLSSLLSARDLDAIFVTGSGQHNSAMVYLTGGGHLTGADVIVPRGGEPILFYRPMERDEAARTGLRTKNLEDYGYADLLKACGGDHIQATARRCQLMLREAGVERGRVALYGKRDAGEVFAIFSAVQAAMPGLSFVGEMSDSTLMQAMMTKDANEIERIRQMGRITTSVVGQAADFLSAQRVKDDRLVDADGTPITIGDVKRRINLWLVERGAENPEGTIFSIGYDAAVPHSSGAARDELRLGQTIVFDIFPCEPGGGYFYDFTRTWCLGYAPDEVLAAYETVLEAYTQMVAALQVNTPFKDYQSKVCDFFEAKGHPTVRKSPQTQEGFVHSLGHGLGLNVHERPWSGSNATEGDVLRPGTVFTIEPGLYYPSRKFGVRLEDTLWMRPDDSPAGAHAEVFVEYPMDLVLPVK